MKILYCIPATHNAGGMERVLAAKANWLQRHGHEVVVVTTDQRGHAPFFAIDGGIRRIDLGVDYEVNNGSPFIVKALAYPIKQWRHRRRLERVLADERPDVTVSMFTHEAPFLYKIGAGGRKILEVHFSRNKLLQYGRHGLWRLADRWRTWQNDRIASRYHRFVTLTGQDRRLWPAMTNIRVIPNACTMERRCAPLTARRALAVGRLCHQKGFDRLIDAWAGVAATHPGWTLAIIGDGEDRAALQQQIGRLGLHGSITLQATTHDMAAEYMRSSMLLMTSRYEGLPMVLVEAQRCGLPAVAMPCQCGPEDVIDDGVNGFVADADNFADRVARLMDDEALRQAMGARACEMSARYDEDGIMRRWEEIFRE